MNAFTPWLSTPETVLRQPKPVEHVYTYITTPTISVCGDVEVVVTVCVCGGVIMVNVRPRPEVNF